MSDSVDRVFSHALNTVNKIRTGSQKPPSATRLRLYGLYKQAMEGDVDGIMDRPAGNSEVDQRAREKWDAWKQQNGLSRTEAKRRYITTLIDTMHKFASPSPDSRELVAELEFVWDQVKSNVPSSQASSPQKEMDIPHIHTSDLEHMGQSRAAAMDDSGRRQREDEDEDDAEDEDQPLRVKSPMSQSEEELEAEEADIDAVEEFVDAPDSQYNPAQDDAEEEEEEAEMDTQEQTQFETQQQPPQQQQQQKQLSQQIVRRNPLPGTPTPKPRMRSIIPQPIPMPTLSGLDKEKPKDKEPTKPNSLEKEDLKWKKRMESAVIKMTAELAALREQLEARRLFAYPRHYRLFRSLWRWGIALFKHLAVDACLLGIVLLWLRWKGGDDNGRLEGAVKVLLGKAVARVKEMRGGKVRLPILPAVIAAGAGAGKKKE